MAPAPAPARRRLALAATAAQDFACCPRRFHALHDLGLREHPRADVPSRGAMALVRTSIALSPRGFFDDPAAAVARVCRARGVRDGARDASSARSLAERLGHTAMGRRLREDPARVLGVSVPFARAVEGDDPLTLDGAVDLVLRGDALGLEGVVAVALSPGDRDGLDAGGGVSRLDAHLALLLARDALSQRFGEATGGAVPVHAAVLRCTEDAAWEPSVLRVDAAGLRERLGELTRQLASARQEARWGSRPRHACDALRCGFMARCHG
ncbi:MAG: PD-(D/E)XK nuclease family protein [Polyangiales bacterium]